MKPFFKLSILVPFIAETSTVTVTASVTTYALASSSIDVLEAVVNRDDIDVQLERISMQEFLKIPNKKQTGKPIQYAVRHERDRPEIYVWPLPENSTDKLKLELESYYNFYKNITSNST